MAETQLNKHFNRHGCECYSQPICNCLRKTVSATYFLENIKDIADTLIEVMIICGIHPCKAKGTTDVIIHSFMHYNEIRYRIDAVPHKRLCKEDLIHDLGRKCLMTRMEAQLTYSIIKRAFKAFYHATGEGGIKNSALEAEALHTSECLWVHAAKRTAQVFASYEGMFFSAQKSYELQIRCAYKRLYDRLQARKYPNETTLCACKSCFHRHNLDQLHREPLNDLRNQELVVPLEPLKGAMQRITSKQAHASNIQKAPPRNRCEATVITDKLVTPKDCAQAVCNLDAEALPENESEALTDMEDTEKKASNATLNLPRCYKCNCPKLVCDCDVDLETGVLSAECSQGPFTCRWVRVDNEMDEDRPDPCITRPEEHECPVDCEPTTSQISVDCECDCDDCECLEEHSSGEDDDNEAIYDDVAVPADEEAMTEETETEPTQLEIPDIKQLRPNTRFAGCRVASQAVEEITIIVDPNSSVEVEKRLIESMKSQSMDDESAGESLSIQMKPSILKGLGAGEGVIGEEPSKRIKDTNEARSEGADEISKIIGDLI